MGSVVLLWLALSASQPGPAGPDTVLFNLDSHDIVWVQHWRFRNGDDVAWADPRYEDAAWPVVDPNRLDDLEAGVHWLRARIVLGGELNPFGALTLRFSKIPVAFEVYWDGIRVAENGRVGPGLDEEAPGALSAGVVLPRSSAEPGPHLLGIRFSNFHKPRRFRDSWAVIAYHADWLLTRSGGLQSQYFHLGIYLISTFVGLALFLGGGRHRAFLLFAIYSLLLTLYWAINPINERFHFNIQFAQILLGFRYLVFFISGILLNFFFIIHFEFPRKTVLFSIAVALPVLIEVAKVRFWLGLEWRDTVTVLYSLGLLAWAVKRRKVGSLVALLGMLGLAWPVLYTNMATVLRFLPKFEGQLFPDLSLLFIPAIILSISRHVREQNRLLEAARSRSHRLETELLKSRIQPHYISNTLHSIKSWFRENPQRADKMIQALSDEFQIINAHSSKALIPLAEEIRLCRNHLEIMGSRRDVQFELDADGLPPGETIPPLVLHTLIENGITHAYGPRESGRFRLRASADGRNVVYTLSNDGSRLREWADKGPNELGEGMGLAYVQARLEESYPGRWSVNYGLKGETWEVTIRIRR